MYKNGGEYSSSRREGGGARGKSPLRRDQPSSSYFPSQRINGPPASSSSSNGNAAAARATSLQREKTSSRMNNGGGANELNERKSGAMGATNMIKSNMKQKRAVARERWNILKQAIINKNSTFYKSKMSIRRFDSFGLIKSIKIAYTGSATNHGDARNRNTNNRHTYRSNQNDDDDSDENDVYYASKTKRSSSRTKYQNNHNENSSKNNRVSSDNEPYQWYSMSVPSVDSSFSVKARFLNAPTDVNNLAGFNNTGNICLWPSEEIMTYFCVKNSNIFDNKSICELGGGMTCLAGLMISKCSEPKEVFLTDGNEASFENLEAICSENEFECSVECCLLQWDKDTNYGDLEERFDYIICADCLFFDEFREDLGATIYKLLKKDGTCLIFAPNRKNTFHKFVDMAKLHFECMIVHDYDLELWEKHLNEKENNPNYDEDIHYPLLLKLKKRSHSTNDFCKMVL